MTNATLQRPESQSLTKFQRRTILSVALSSTLVWLVLVLIAMDFGLKCLKPLQYVSIQGLVLKDSDTLPEKVESAFSRLNREDFLLMGSSLLNALTEEHQSERNNLFEHPAAQTNAWEFEVQMRSQVHTKQCAVNIGVSGAMMSDQLRIVQELIQLGRKPRAIFLFVAPRDFSDNNVLTFKDSRVWQYFDTRPGSLFLPGSTPKDALEHLLDGTWRFFDRRGDYRRVCEIGACKFFDRQPTLFAAANSARKQFDIHVNLPLSLPWDNKASVADSGALQSYKEQMKDYYRRAYAPGAPGRLEKQFAALEKLLELCKKNGIAAVVVEMPLSPTFDRILPDCLRVQYHSEVAQSCRACGAKLVCMESVTEFPDGDFSDGIHLNQQGARKFWKELVGKIKDDLKELSSSENQRFEKMSAGTGAG